MVKQQLFVILNFKYLVRYQFYDSMTAMTGWFNCRHILYEFAWFIVQSDYIVLPFNYLLIVPTFILKKCVMLCVTNITFKSFYSGAKC